MNGQMRELLRGEVRVLFQAIQEHGAARMEMQEKVQFLWEEKEFCFGGVEFKVDVQVGI